MVVARTGAAAWRLLTDVRFAVVLIILLALAGLVGMLVRQFPVTAADDPARYAAELDTMRAAWDSLPAGSFIVDAFDAMTQFRPYREPLSIMEAVEELRRERGRQFDAALVDEFVGVEEPHDIGEVLDLAEHFGFTIKSVQDFPTTTRAVLDRRQGALYIPQRDSLRTRAARFVIFQSLGHIALEHEVGDAECETGTQAVAGERDGSPTGPSALGSSPQPPSGSKFAPSQDKARWAGGNSSCSVSR